MFWFDYICMYFLCGQKMNIFMMAVPYLLGNELLKGSVLRAHIPQCVDQSYGNLQQEDCGSNYVKSSAMERNFHQSKQRMTHSLSIPTDMSEKSNAFFVYIGGSLS